MLEAEAEELHASAAKTRHHLAVLEAKVALRATEEKRQAAYAARLAKKEESLAALEQALDAMRQRVEATTLFSEKEEVERTGHKAKRADEAARKEEAVFVERMMKRVKVRLGGNDLVADARKDGEELRRGSGVCPLPRRS